MERTNYLSLHLMALRVSTTEKKKKKKEEKKANDTTQKSTAIAMI